MEELVEDAGALDDVAHEQEQRDRHKDVVLHHEEDALHGEVEHQEAHPQEAEGDAKRHERERGREADHDRDDHEGEHGQPKGFRAHLA